MDPSNFRELAQTFKSGDAGAEACTADFTVQIEYHADEDSLEVFYEGEIDSGKLMAFAVLVLDADGQGVAGSLSYPGVYNTVHFAGIFTVNRMAAYRGQPLTVKVLAYGTDGVECTEKHYTIS